MKALEGFHNFVWIFCETIKSFSSPRLYAPWAVLLLLQGLLFCLFLYFLSPPLDTFMVPTLSLIFGERFFHYPDSLILLPKAFYYGNLLLGVLVGSLLGGVAVYLFGYHFSQQRARFGGSLSLAFSRYPSLIVLWGIESLLLVLFLILPQKLFSPWTLGSPRRALGLQVTSFTLALVGVTFLSYSFISVILSRGHIVASIRESVKLARRRFFTTFFFVCIPFLIHLPLDYLVSQPELLVSKFHPQLIVYLLGMGMVLSVFCNFLLVGNLTHLFQLSRGEGFGG